MSVVYAGRDRLSCLGPDDSENIWEATIVSLLPENAAFSVAIVKEKLYAIGAVYRGVGGLRIDDQFEC